MTGVARHTTRTVATVIAAIAAVALAVGLLAADEARRALAFEFTGVERTPATAISILANNVGVAAAAIAAALVLELARRQTAAPGGRPFRIVRAACDVLIAWPVALNVAIVGASIGAYGSRMVRALLPHGPVELIAFAVVLAVYLRARSTPMTRAAVSALGLALGLLAGAAALETFAGAP